MMNKNLTVTSPPFVRAKNSTYSVMLDVIIALLPPVAAAVVIFGFRALAVTVITVISAVAFEALWNVLLKKEQSITDLSAVVSGIILALNLPVSIPLWIPVIGSFFMIIVVKMFFGGLGNNFLNPAAAARAFLLASWPVAMTCYTKPFEKLSLFGVDAVSSATPLADPVQAENILNLFLGNRGGSMGEVYIPAILIGLVYLFVRRVITWHAPVGYAATVLAVSWIAGQNPLSALLCGGVIFASVYMVTDYTTTPVTNLGKLIFGIGTGLITMLIRYKGGYPEGVTYAILLMNILVPYIEKITAPTPFGRRAKNER